MGWRYFANRHAADTGEYHALQHIQTAVLGDIFPVLCLQPLLGDDLEGVLCFAGLPDAVDLPLLGGIDALLDQFACGLTAFPGFRERNSRVFAKRKHAGLAIQCEAVSPSLDSVGLDFEVEPALVIQAVELLPGLGVAAVRVGKHGG